LSLNSKLKATFQR